MRRFSRVLASAVVLALVAAVVLSGLFVSIPSARAQPAEIPWLDMGIITQEAGFNRGLAAVVTDGTTAMYVFYYTVFSAANINVTKLTLGTGMFGTPTPVFDEQVNDPGNTNMVSPQYPMSATMDASGNLYVAWTHIAVPGSGSAIFVSKSSDGGVTWDPAVQASEPSATAFDAMPSIAVAPNGTVYVAYSQQWPPMFVNITMSHSTDGGQTFTGYANVSGQGAPGMAEYGSLSIDSGGRLYLAYTGIDLYMFGLVVNVTTSDDGLTWTEPVPLTPMSFLAEMPSTVVDARGNVHIFWFDFRSYLLSGTVGVWHSMSMNRGASWSPAVSVSEWLPTPYGAPFLSVAMHFDEIMVAWAGYTGSTYGMSYVVSPDAGQTWTHASFFSPGPEIDYVALGADQNGTFYAAATMYDGSNEWLEGLVWFGPPTAPVITSVAPGAARLTVSWSASPEPDVQGYQLLRSSNGVDFAGVAAVDAGTTSYVDTDLANGTYWYELVAVNDWGLTSDASAAVSGTLGPSLESLQDQINQLQSDLNSANADLAAIQSRLDALRGQLNSLQGNTTALQNQIQALQDQLDSVQAQQATGTMSLATLAFEVIVVVLLVALLVIELRKPKKPTVMMAQPAQAAPTKPEDEL